MKDDYKETGLVASYRMSGCASVGTGKVKICPKYAPLPLLVGPWFVDRNGKWREIVEVLIVRRQDTGEVVWKSPTR